MLRADGTIDTRYSLMPFDIEGLIARARAGDVEAQLLLDLDWREPNQQAFPTTATGVIPGRTATEIFLCDEPSGNLVGEVASVTLAPTNSPIQGIAAVGFYDGTDAHGESCVEIGTTGATQEFKAASSATFAIDDTESIALLVVWRTTGVGSYDSPVVIKAASNRGYFFRQSSAGQASWLLGDGTGFQTLITSGVHNDGAWHAGLFVVDRSTGDLLTYTDVGSNSAAITKTGDSTDTDTFSIGPGDGGVQVAYLAVFEGANAEGLVQSDLDTFWTQNSQYTTPELDTYSRASLVAPQVGDEPGFGVRVAKVPAGAFAFGYDSTFAHASKLGMVHERAHTNLCKGSEEAATGADYADIGTPTLTSNALEAPDGTFTMNRIAASGGVEGRQQTIAVSASTRYTFSTHVRRGIDATNAFGELEVFDATNVATIDNVQIDLNTNDERVRPSIEVVTPVGCVSVEIRFKVDDGSDMAEWGWQYEEGHLSSYIPTSTATTATRVKVDAVLLNPGGDTYLQSDAGEVEVVLSHYNDEVTDTRYMFDTGAGNPDRTTLQVIANEQGGFNVRDSTGVTQVAISTAPAPGGGWDAERTVRGRWNSNNVLSGHTVHADMFIGAVRTEDAAATSTWTAGTGAANLEIAQARVANFSADGIVARTRIYNKPRPDVP